MKRRIIAVVLFTVIIASVLTACGGDKKEVAGGDSFEGKYKSMVGYILLNKDGTFIVDNKMILTGKYAIKDKKVGADEEKKYGEKAGSTIKEIEFNVEKMNGQEVGNIVYGFIKDKTITGPDGILYTKE